MLEIDIEQMWKEMDFEQRRKIPSKIYIEQNISKSDELNDQSIGERTAVSFLGYNQERPFTEE